MKRFMIPRVVHCSEGCARVLGKTLNCPHGSAYLIFLPKRRFFGSQL
jgi:hypothetical protein